MTTVDANEKPDATFSGEQKSYLEGLISGVQAKRAAQGLKPLGEGGGAGEPVGPDAGASQGPGQDRGLRQEARGPGEVEAGGASVRRL